MGRVLDAVGGIAFGSMIKMGMARSFVPKVAVAIWQAMGLL
jgi:hypothetical protein